MRHSGVKPHIVIGQKNQMMLDIIHALGWGACHAMPCHIMPCHEIRLFVNKWGGGIIKKHDVMK